MKKNGNGPNSVAGGALNFLELGKKRLVIFGVMAFLVAFGLIFRLYQIQIREYQQWSTKSERSHIKKMSIEKPRGIIYDRGYNELAVSLPCESVFVDPAIMTMGEDNGDSALELAESLALCLDENFEIIYEKIINAKKSRFLWIKRGISPLVATAIRNARLKGVHLIKEYKRLYPQGKLAAHILGFTGTDSGDIMDNRGLEGIEFQFDQWLKGSRETVKSQMGATSAGLAPIKSPAADGLILTIDQYIQHIVEREMDELVESCSSEVAFAIVYDPQNGDILAMANRPTFDPNDFSSYPRSSYKNRAIVDMFEPGSTLKIMTVAAALDCGAIDNEEKFRCDGIMEIDGGNPVKCTGYHGLVTGEEILMHSCNIGSIKVAQRLGRERFFEYLQKAGFGTRTGITFPGEALGIMRNFKNWFPRDFASLSFGQSIAVTGIQLISALSSVANGGVVMKPRLVKGVITKEGESLDFNPVKYSTVFQEKTAYEVMEMLGTVVSKGTGKRAQVEGISVGGKTGTAEMPNPEGGYYKDKNLVSFIAFAPVHNTRLAVLVLAANPMGGRRFGGTLAAPSCARIISETFNYLGLRETELAIVESIREDMPTILVPNFVGLEKNLVLSRIDSFDLPLKIVGDGDKVIYQFPKFGTKIVKGREIEIYLNAPDTDSSTLPCLLGKSMREALGILNKLGLKGDIVGKGTVLHQFPPPGTSLREIDDVFLELSPAGLL